ncbi:MAG: sulfurtransferase TusA family protein [Pseudomonadota bacterium]
MSIEVRELDVKGMNCPMPLLKAKKTLNAMAADELLRVYATDPGSVRDFEVFAKQSGNALMEAEEIDGVYTYLLKKKS